MTISNRSVTLAHFALSLVLASCSNSGNNADTSIGGSSAVSSSAGGKSATGSVASTNGTVGAGGTVGTGGSVGNGGTVGAGGSDATSIVVGSGGVAPVGGQSSGVGGRVGTGGLSNGGRVGTSGSASGGRVGTGGVTGAGLLGGTSGTGTVGTASAGKGGANSSTIGASAGAGGSGALRTTQIKTRGFTFDALESGSGGEPVLLLHGFPEISLEWSGLMPVLAANGYHCLAPDQRGYSPGARPTEVDAYKYEELVADAFAFGSELGEKFHLVAHDWGANIAWLMLQKDPSRIASFTAIAVPHYQIWARAVYNDPDMAGYLSMLNTWMTPGKGEDYWTATAMRNMWKAKPADLTERTIAHMLEPGAMTAALNWYRASDGHKSVINDFEAWEVNVPTLLIFGSTDIGQKTVTDTKPLMTGPYRVVQPKGGHFIVDEQPQVVADETLKHLRAYPVK